MLSASRIMQSYESSPLNSRESHTKNGRERVGNQLSHNDEAVKTKVTEMDETLDGKPIAAVSADKTKKVGIMDQAQIKHKIDVVFEPQHGSWWSILRYWIEELRWRRAFWTKMAHPITEEIES
jgi:hypothetical protein